MVLMPASFVGYHVFWEDLEYYRIHAHLPKNDRHLVNDIGSKLELTFVCVEVGVSRPFCISQVVVWPSTAPPLMMPMLFRLSLYLMTSPGLRR